MIRCLLVDDEPLVCERLRSLLSAHADAQVVGERGDGLSALDAVHELEPDVVFLDIQMPGLTGLEVAEAWKRDGILPILIFVTAYDQFAIEAFRLHALDYLTKPIEPERFAEALGRARQLLGAPDRDGLERRIQAMLEVHERRKASRPHIVVRDKDRYVLVPTREIQCLEATGNYVQIHCANARHLVRNTLSALAATLDPERFLRTHRSWMVNLDYVREAHPWSKGAWVLVTRGGVQVPVGHQYRDALHKILG